MAGKAAVAVTGRARSFCPSSPVQHVTPDIAGASATPGRTADGAIRVPSGAVALDDFSLSVLAATLEAWRTLLVM